MNNWRAEADEVESKPPGRHFVCLEGIGSETLAGCANYLQRGLQLGQEALVWTGSASSAELLTALRAAISVGTPLAATETWRAEAGICPPPACDALPERALRELAEAQARGAFGLRLLIDLTALPADTPDDSVLAYEAGWEALVADQPLDVLCLYNAVSLSPSLAEALLAQHEWLLVGAGFCRNPYYVPPSAVDQPEELLAQRLRRLHAECESRQQLEYLASFPEMNPNPILEVDGHNRLVFANEGAERACARLGQAHDPTPLLPDDMAEIRRELAHSEIGRIHREVLVGEVLWAENLSEGREPGHIRIYARDVTALREAETKLARMSRFYAALGRINEAIIRSQTPEQIFTQVCNILVTDAGLRMVSVGLVDAASSRIVPVEACGKGTDYVREVIIAVDEGPLGTGPTGTAVREGEPVVCSDIATDPAMEPWREEALRHGFRSSAAFPLRRGGRVIGAISLYSEQAHDFGADLMDLLQAMATDMSFGLDTIQETRERIEAQANLQETTARLRTLIDSSPAAIVMLDMQTRVQLWNAAAERIFGWTAQELAGQPMRLHQDEQQRVIEANIARVMRGEHIAQLELQFTARDGRKIDVGVSAGPVLNEQGQVVAILGVLVDLTDSKRTARSLQRTNEALNALVEASPLGIVILSATGEIQVWSPAAERISGWSAAEVIGRRPPAANPDGEVAEFIAMLKDATRGGRPIQREFIRRRKDGVPIEISVAAASLLDANGQIVSVMGIIDDITERKRAEAALRTSELTTRALLNASHDVSFLMDLEGHIIAANQATAEVMGIPLPQLVGIDLFMQVPPEVATLYRERVQEAIRTGAPVHAEDERAGHWRESTIYPVQDAAGVITCLAMYERNTTEARQADREREATIALLQRISAAQDLRELTHSVVSYVSAWAGCEAVGLRLREGDDYPFFEMHGFPKEFMQAEKTLLGRSLTGEPLRDQEGVGLLTCFCGDLIRGGANRFLPCFTEHGSFWTNDLRRFRRDKTYLPPSSQVHDNCLTAGFQSVVMVPLRMGETTLGLIHLADQRPGFFSAGVVAVLERLGDALAIALAQRTAEAQLRDSERRFRTLIENMSDGLVETDHKRVIRYASPRFIEAIGRPATEILGQVIESLADPSDTESIRRSWTERQSGRRGRYEVGWITKTGERIDSLVSATPVFDDSGSFAGSFAVITDISEPKRAERALRESEQRYRRIVETTTEGIWVLDGEAFTEYVNESMCAMLGYEPEEMIGRSYFDFLDERMRPEALEQWEQRRQGLRGIRDLCLRGKAGQEIWCICSATPAFDDEGGFVGVLAMLANITERKEMEVRLARSLEFYLTLFDEIPNPIWRADVTGQCDFFNKSWLEFRGRTLADELGEGWVEGVHPDDREQCLQTYMEAFTARRPFVMEYRLAHRDGTYHWLVDFGQPFFDLDGKFAGYIGSCYDVHERRQAEDALQEEKERLAVTLQSIGDAVIATDVRGQVVLVNRVAEHLTGWTEAEALGQPIRTVFNIMNAQTGEVADDPVERVLATDQIVGLANDTVLISRDGARYSIADTGAPIRDAEGNLLGAVLAFRDVTEEYQLREAALKAERLEALGVLAGGIAHDFNNILLVILGNLQLATKADAGEERKVRALLSAERAAQKARGLTQQFLTFARGGAPVKEPTSIADLVRETATLALSGSNVRLELTAAPDLWTVEVDPAQMSQVIHNLVVNADQAMPEGGTLFVHIENTMVPEGESAGPAPGRYVRVAVRDQGVGMTADQIARIFDPYFTTKVTGHGLGLATVYSIMARHDGHLEASSTPGMGSTFTLYIRASRRAVVQAEAEEAEIPTGTERILLLDDDPDVVELTCATLEDLGYQVAAATTGEQALQLYREALDRDEPFDAVLLDLTVRGGIGGQEVIRELLEMDPLVRAIVCSGYSASPILAHPADYGFRGVVIKPFDLPVLARTVRRVLDEG